MAFLFYILAIICFGIATVGDRVSAPVNLVALGLAFFATAHVIN